jgi:hypothetical protein
MHEDLGTTKRLSGAEPLRPKETRQTPKPLTLTSTFFSNMSARKLLSFSLISTLALSVLDILC